MVRFSMWVGYGMVHGRSSKYTAAEEKRGSIAVAGKWASPPRRAGMVKELGLSAGRAVVDVYGGGADE